MPIKASDNPKPFKKGQSGNPNGRPRLTLKAVIDDLKAQGYEQATPADVSAMYSYLITLPQDKITELAKNDAQPMAVRICCKAILDKKGFDYIERMLDRAHGKAANKTELSGKDGGPIRIESGEDLKKLSEDELRRIAALG